MPVTALGLIRRMASSRLALAASIAVGALMAVSLAGSGSMPAAPIASAAPAAPSGPIGAYVEPISAVAFDVESSGRVHVIWTGKLNPDFDGDFTYYSTSADGVTWTPYQILDYYAVNQPQVVVDDTRHLAHLVYRGYDGIVHRVAANGTVGAPRVVSWGQTFGAPSLAVDPTSGKAFVAWRESYMQQKDEITWHGMYRSWFSVWDGAAWAAPWRAIHDGDTSNTLVAAAPGAKVMMAWFQGWSTTVGNGATAGGPAYLRTAYSTDGTTFAVRQQANTEATAAPKEEAFLLAAASDGKFYLLTDYFMWPGHSIARRYVWSGGAWSAALPVSDNPADWATPVYVGTAGGTAYYVYQVAGVQWLRTESTLGVLSAPSTFGTVIAATGLSGASPMKVDSAGKWHLLGLVTGQAGIYYARQP
jgi:hypothetical protein